MMNVFKNKLFVIFLLICFGLTCYETYIQLSEYVRNEDNAFIEYRNFNLEEKDTYPTFTICFLGDFFNNDHQSFTTNNITPATYGWFLMGYEDDDPKYDQILYEDVSLNIIDKYVSRFDSAFSNGSDFYRISYDTENKNRNEIPLSITIQQPIIHHGQPSFLRCISKNVSYQRNIIQTADGMWFNAKLLSQKEFEVRLYIHQIGQAMQALRTTPRLEITDTSEVLEINQEYEYSIDRVEVLRKRHDGKIRCDENLLDETKLVRNMIMRKVGCIPAYWQIFAGDLSQKLPKCIKNQYEKIFMKYLSKWTFSNPLESMYTQPCLTMTLSAIHREGNIEKVKSVFEFVFRYDQKYYKAIINKRAYTSGSLLGQVGGYVGKNKI